MPEPRGHDSVSCGPGSSRTLHGLAPFLVAASALVILLLGVAHLVLTFRGDKLHPRDAALEAAMNSDSPILTRETTMWRASIGFNASHSYGAILFGSVYAFLALAHGGVLFASPYLLGVGLAFLSGYLFLGYRYWFSIPLRGISVATALYVLALAASWISASG